MRGRAAAEPLRTLLMLASFAVTAYAGLRLLDNGQVLELVLWFVGAALLHDLVLLPLYSLADRALTGALHRRGASPTPAVNYVRVPVFLSGMLLLVWFPLILRTSQRYEPYTTLQIEVFLWHWLLLTAAFLTASALTLVLRTLPAHRTRRRTDPPGL
ncbi:hypothetical protein ACFWU3_29485 [Streptomyces sp. NPDC058685]|uniref:hypothetical protein n=1 Tax=Streptomyces sp. NPDC058685 TaxID=3346598 RepID=UPI003659B1A8